MLLILGLKICIVDDDAYHLPYRSIDGITHQKEEEKRATVLAPLLEAPRKRDAQVAGVNQPPESGIDSARAGLDCEMI